jgi:hypothetical protein
MALAALVLSCAGAALAVPTAQQKCNSARVTAWKKFQSCVDAVLAKDAKGVSFDAFAAHAKCRHKYFAKWAAFQSYAGSTCVGTRFTDNGDQTVTDNLTGLVWEKKDDSGSVHDKDNTYTWSTGAPYKEDGTLFSSFLFVLNVSTFGGANGWRVPTLAELQTIVLDFKCKGSGGGPTCTCPSSPCVDPALDAANTQALPYWTSSSTISYPFYAWTPGFSNGNVFVFQKFFSQQVRAVRGGW